MKGLLTWTVALAVVCLMAFQAEAQKPGDGSFAMKEQSSRAIVGDVWKWVSLKNAESLYVGNSMRYTLEMKPNGHYFVQADCNTGSGLYQIAGNRLSLFPGPFTLASCGPDSLGNRYAQYLSRVSTFERHGDLMVLALQGSDEVMEFKAVKPIELAGTSWLVAGYNNGKGGVVSVNSSAGLRVVFRKDGTISGSAGCNNFRGVYEVEEREEGKRQEIKFGRMATTRKLCSGEIMEREKEFLAALTSAVIWSDMGNQLELRRSDGALAVKLVSAITGSVVFPEGSELPDGALVAVSLQDVSRMDVPAINVSTQLLKVADPTKPTSFTVVFDPSDIDSRMRYSVRASVRQDQKLLFTSTRSYPVITRNAPYFDVEVALESVIH